MQKLIRLGTRNSKLALIQTNLVINAIKCFFPKTIFVIVPIITSGDRIKDKNLYDIGGKALFSKEIEISLLEHKIDLAIHSLKDMPCRIDNSLVISAVLEQEDARDVFVSKKYNSIYKLPIGARVGTSSVRRKIWIQYHRNDLEIVTFRGNVDSRIKKFLTGQVDATILAYSGLKRLGLYDKKYCHIISIDDMIPSVGQGVIAIERRRDDSAMEFICSKINHIKTWELIQAGRGFLHQLNADCSTPIAAYSEYLRSKIYTRFMLSNIAGTKILTYNNLCDASDAYAVGINTACFMSENL